MRKTKLLLKVKSIFLPPSCPYTSHPFHCPPVPDIIITPPQTPTPPTSIPTCHPPSYPCCLSPLPLVPDTCLTSPAPLSILSLCLDLPHPFTIRHPSTLPPCLSAPLILSVLPPLPIAVPTLALAEPLPLRPSPLSDTLCVAGELPSVFHLPLSHLSHSLPADPPTQRVLTIHAGGRTHGPWSCQRAPRTVHALPPFNSRGSVRLPGTGEKGGGLQQRGPSVSYPGEGG